MTIQQVGISRMQDKVLILGGAGYIGSALVQKLSSNPPGLDITVVDSFEYGQKDLVRHIFKHPNVRLIQQDLAQTPLKKDFIQQFDTVIHLAAIVGAPACDKNPERATAINLGVTKHIVDNLRDDQLLIFPNTNSGYGQVKEGVCTEETPLNAISTYGKDKDRAEQYIRKNHKKHVVFRLATLFGTSPRTRMDLLVNTMAYEASFGGVITVFDPGLRRNYVHVDDVVDAFEFAMNNPKMVGEVYNLGLDEANMTKLELARKVGILLASRVDIKDGYDPDQRDYLVSSKKLEKAGFKATRSLDQGIMQINAFCVGLPRIGREGALAVHRNI